MDTLDIAYRGYAEYQPKEQQHRSSARAKAPQRRPKYVLVFDTETTIDTEQRLNFGVYRYLRLAGRSYSCVYGGLFYADDLPERDPAGFMLLQNYAVEHTLKLFSRSDFITKIFVKAAFNNRATVVGFNLPFDISRLAVDWREARGEYRGGFSFIFSTYIDATTGEAKENPFVPRIRIKNIDNTKSLIAFTKPYADDGDNDEDTYRGKFLDLRTLAFALTAKKYTLDSACKDFGVKRKQVVEEHGIITSKYIDYAYNDVRISCELFEEMLNDYLEHPITVEPHSLFSPASLGKAYLKEMAITPLRDKNPDFSKEILGYCMQAYYGGRSECRIRNTPVPVVYCDFTSMYPTVNALMGLWECIISERLFAVDATDDVQAFVNSVTLSDMFNPELWQQLRCVVQVSPDTDIMPVRGRYNTKGQSYNIGSSYYTSNDPVWYMLPDVIASKLLTGKTPHIISAYLFIPEGKEAGLLPSNLAGTIPVIPDARDFFLSVIEEKEHANNRGDNKAKQALKILANATSYGIYAEMTRKELPGTDTVRVEVYTGNEHFYSDVDAPEEIGTYCFPPIASLITSAARLMLALLECCVTDLGGSYAMCDTDSMAIVAAEQSGLIACAGGSYHLPDDTAAIKALSWEETQAIINRFASLNPYDQSAVSGSILKIEKNNYDARGNQITIWCYAIAAKRYALFTRDDIGLLQDIVEAKEHGLGHILNPKARVAYQKDAIELLEDEETDININALPWIHEIWALIIKEALGEKLRYPDYFKKPAITRLAITSTHLSRPSAAYKLQPFTFMLMAHQSGIDQMIRKAKIALIAPFEKDAAKWGTLQWVDISTAQSYTIGTFDAELSPWRIHREAYTKTIGAVYQDYKRHPEYKSADADGQPCQVNTRGLLARRYVVAGERHIIGKESNKVQRVAIGEYQQLEDVQLEYQHRRCVVCGMDISGFRSDANVCNGTCRKRLYDAKKNAA